MRADQRARRDAFLSKIGVHPVVMGVLNLTPDSFSDGGLFQSTDAAILHAEKMTRAGADIVDVVADIRRYFDRSLALSAKAGVPEARIVLDPGIGFSKTARQNIAVVARLGE